MKRANPNELTKAYTLPHSGNAGKIQALQYLYAQYQQEYAFHLQDRWTRFLKGDKTALSYIGSTKAIDTQLPSAILQGLLKCVTEHLKSYISSQQALIRRVIHQSTLSHSDKHQLHSLNWMTLWTHPQQYASDTQTCLNWAYVPAYFVSTNDFGESVKVKNETQQLRPLPLDKLRLIRQIAQYTQHLSPLKVPMYPRLILDSRAIQFQSAKTSKTHQHWLSITTLTKGQRVKVPVLLHEYAQQAGSDFNGSVELLFRDNQLTFVLTQTKDKSDWLTLWQNKHPTAESSLNKMNQSEVVAFDIGLSTLLVSSEGDCYGQNWLKQLSKYDKKLTDLTAQRQRLGLKEQGHRQETIVQQIRGFIKTEVGRIINHWVKSHPHVKTVVLEKLYFQNPSLSKRLNRMIQNFGLARIKAKFKELGKLKGFSVVEVHPAYTSQECNHCGWVSEYNRPSQKEFRCECCSKKHYADSKASCSIYKRFIDGSYLNLHSKGQCLSFLRSQFVSQLAGRIRSGIVDLTLLRGILAKGVNKNRALIADPASLAWLTEALKRVYPF